MRTSTFNYIKDILGDYYKTDDYIRQREEELRYPFRESDLNSGIKGSHGNNEAAANLLITIELDRRLASLERNKRIIDKVLSESCEDTITIIQELHFKKRPRFTMQGLIDQGKIFCSRRKAFELQRIFFEEIAKELNLDI
ncbi:transcriptional regulator [Enterococcus faecalis]|uniref:Transcriptional regulator n=2 Tax=Enterococcus faecalis TaxID=1351 RepID=A0AC59HMG7_ENTFL|nr:MULTISPECIES: phage transcriptional regulator, RinA family [Bacteria]MDN6613471.1 transcriptional regulator [Lactococcus lactis]HEF7651390.1 transcriptional regulator [Campylobacter jejuni]EJB2784738.1 transcriptional regulator [Enterococcus faecalis]ERL10177.1 phage transcriptional regulator, RinA family [Enterococcus faecalis E12]MBE8774260.1 transcriptional regulator [Enterococcus faecalis]